MKRLVLSVCALGLLVGATMPVLAASGKVVIKIAGMKPEGEPETTGMHLSASISMSSPATSMMFRFTRTPCSARKTSTLPIHAAV